MKEINIKVKNISQKQWANLLIELNLVKKAWRPYGVDLQISAPGLKNILKCAETGEILKRRYQG